MREELFESIYRMNEITTTVLANAFAKQFDRFDSTSQGALEIVNFITKNLGTVSGQGLNGITDDIKSDLRTGTPANKAIAFGIIRSKNPPKSLGIVKQYAKQLGNGVDAEAVERAVQMVNQNQNMALTQADQAARN